MRTDFSKSGSAASRQRSGAQSKFKASQLELELEVFRRVCVGINTPRSLACWILASNGEWAQYMDLPRPDSLSETFADDYLVSSVFTKSPLLQHPDLNPRKKAMEKYVECEALCRVTNERVRRYLDGHGGLGITEDVLTKLTSSIAQTLGDYKEALSRFDEECAFGPGATSTISGRNVCLSNKYTAKFECTSKLYNLMPPIVPFAGEPIGQELVKVQGNKVIFVPKTAKVDRVIAIEPHGNIFAQKALGSHLRRRLRSSLGVDLDHQADENRRLASRAQQSGLCTIDLSSASDTIAVEMVKLLVPIHWFILMDTLRSPASLLPGADGYVQNEKFASMGNGFTFELETLLFICAARVFDPDAVAFGDDIICKREYAGDVVDLLEKLGFQVNKTKSFFEGNFFESCGEDYWNGQNVRPFYFRKEYDNVQQWSISLANRIRVYANRRLSGFGCDVRFRSAWLYLLRRSGNARTTVAPAFSGDHGFYRDFDEPGVSVPRHRCYDAWVFPILTDLARPMRPADELGALIATLHHPAKEPLSREVKRGRRGQLRRSVMVYHDWPSLGDWI